MKINELLSKYTFHDSLLENISYDKENNTLILTIDFCFWMQTDYEESQPETGHIKLSFNNIENYDGLIGDIDSYSILNTSYENDTLTFSLLDDFHDEYHEIKIHAQNAIIQ